MDNKVNITEKIWQEADRQRYTKAAFAAAVGISRQTLDNWINGVSTPSTNSLTEMSKILGIIVASDGSIAYTNKGALVFQDGYIGMHERVWSTVERVLDRDGATLNLLSETINNLTKDKTVTP